ncbi:MAG: elongation factor P maturation arginine rhamnosyltransferase EarP [Burkholderiales bacterium]
MVDKPTSRWDIFCRVIDNHGDLGVCWRLACDLAARGRKVRLWVDDASALAWMAPAGALGVSVLPWPEAGPCDEPFEVVVEAFGCELPVAVVARMAQMEHTEHTPVWINLEYLSAEAFVERCHGLPSPQAGGLRKWFYYPGFTPGTGGLIRESDLLRRQQSFDANAWLRAQGVVPRDSEHIVSLFCYEQPALPALLEQLSKRPTLLLATAGHAARQVESLLGPSLRRGTLRAHLLPALPQTGYDHLLWSSDLNFVRGEDSFVRAQWAGKPFVWQIYPQADGADALKLQAFLDQFLALADAPLASRIRATWSAWNTGAAAWPTEPEDAAWQRHCSNWRDTLARQSDLASQLIGFAAQTR